MTLKSAIEQEKNKIKIDGTMLDYLKKEIDWLVSVLNNEIKETKTEAEVFVGGSFAKGTIVMSDYYDIDVFVRFGLNVERISEILEKIITRAAKKGDYKVSKVYGSRNYFKVEKGKLKFEIIPVYKIKKPQDAKNVTDLSYFHVNYVKKKMKGDLSSEIMLAKKFCQAQGVYGAESYINGFSGYGIECLIIYYGSCEKMLLALAKIKRGEKVIIDPEKSYKNKEDILLEINESKLHSPIILVDPTWKERNVLAALSEETFERFQDSARKFLSSPSGKFFEAEEFSEEKFRALSGEFLHLRIKTDRQEGDIAGTKMKKFSRFIEEQVGEYFDIVKSEFVYAEGQEADFYFVLKSRKEVVKRGPPISMKESAKEFRKRNKNVFEKQGNLYSRIKIDFTAREFLSGFIKKEMKKKILEMGIVGVEII